MSPNTQPDRPPLLDEPGTTVLEGPRREGSELLWTVRARDGSTVVVAMLVPELARDDAVRRRWVSDVQRVATLAVEGVLPTLQVGPKAALLDAAARPPWRVTQHRPNAETLEHWLTRRAPLPVDEAAATVAQLADIVDRIHAVGVVLRDLHPRRILVEPDGTVTLADIGLTRVDVLSSRTAASLILEGSPYASPEQFTRTAVDGRSDVYGLGVILFRALTGVLPYDDEPAILRPPGAVPPRARPLRPAVDPLLDEFLARCLEDDPLRRPDSAAAVARALRGETVGTELQMSRVPCQSCGRALRPGQRLCTHCGRQAVLYVHAPSGTEETYDVVLTRIDEDAATRAELRETLSLLGEGEPPPLNLLIGDRRMYSSDEQKRLLTLPLPLFRGLQRATADALQAQLNVSKKLSVRVRPTRVPMKMTRRAKRVAASVAAGGISLTVGMLVLGLSPYAAVVAGVTTIVSIAAMAMFMRDKGPKGTPLMQLRSAPAALEASDPWVGRLAALLGGKTEKGVPDDVRDLLGSLALAVQRLVDHRAENVGGAREIDAATDPVEQLVTLVEAQVSHIAAIDAELPTLDEGALVRALAAARTRGEDGQSRHDASLAALDRLRTLEDARAAAFHRLLEAGALIRRAVDIGLSVHDDHVAHESEVARALALLTDDASHV